MNSNQKDMYVGSVRDLVTITPGFNPTKRDGTQRTPLHRAIDLSSGESAQMVPLVQALLDAGCNVEERFRGFSPLHLAVAKCFPMVEALLAGGADIDATANAHAVEVNMGISKSDQALTGCPSNFTVENLVELRRSEGAQGCEQVEAVLQRFHLQSKTPAANVLVAVSRAPRL